MRRAATVFCASESRFYDANEASGAVHLLFSGVHRCLLRIGAALYEYSCFSREPKAGHDRVAHDEPGACGRH